MIMMGAFILIMSTLSLALSTSLVEFTSTTETTDDESWTYSTSSATTACSPTNKCVPNSWGQISPTNGVINQCASRSSTTSQQSPVNIVGAAEDYTLTMFKDISTAGGCKDWLQYCDEHAFHVDFFEGGCQNLQIQFTGNSGSINSGGMSSSIVDATAIGAAAPNNYYKLIKLHFHSPSEHTFGGGYADAEVHFVHQSVTTGATLVVAVLLNSGSSGLRGANNVFLNNFWTAAANRGFNTSSNDSSISNMAHFAWNVTNSSVINPYASFLPSTTDYYAYIGSLTSYPCTEKVTWLVMKDPVAISPVDLSILRTSVSDYKKSNPIHSASSILDVNGNNNRPLQPLNGRVISQYNPASSNIWQETQYQSQDLEGTTEIAIAALILVIMIFVIGGAAVASKYDDCNMFDDDLPGMEYIPSNIPNIPNTEYLNRIGGGMAAAAGGLRARGGGGAVRRQPGNSGSGNGSGDGDGDGVIEVTQSPWTIPQTAGTGAVVGDVVRVPPRKQAPPTAGAVVSTVSATPATRQTAVAAAAPTSSDFIETSPPQSPWAAAAPQASASAPTPAARTFTKTPAAAPGNNISPPDNPPAGTGFGNSGNSDSGFAEVAHNPWAATTNPLAAAAPIANPFASHSQAQPQHQREASSIKAAVPAGNSTANPWASQNNAAPFQGNAIPAQQAGAPSNPFASQSSLSAFGGGGGGPGPQGQTTSRPFAGKKPPSNEDFFEVSLTPAAAAAQQRQSNGEDGFGQWNSLK